MHNEVQPASASAAVAETTPGDIGEVSLLEHAIISTMVYRDLFNYAVTVAEIHRYLHGVQCPESRECQFEIPAPYFCRRFKERIDLLVRPGHQLA